MKELPGGGLEGRAILVDEVEQEGGGVRLPGNDPPGGEVDPGLGVGVPGVPAGDLPVVVELVRQIPPEDDVAESEPALGRGEELVERDVLSAPDAVDVDAPLLGLGDPLLHQPCLQRRV
jgi:hypothetical protein